MPRRRTKTPDGEKVQPVKPVEPEKAGDKSIRKALDEAPDPYEAADNSQPGGYKHRPSHVIKTARRLQAYQLRRQGLLFDEIANEMGCTKVTAFQFVQAALQDMSDMLNESVREVYKGEWNKLDMMEDALWPKAMNGSVEAIDRVLKIQAQRARLFGLNAPEGVYHHHEGSIDINLNYNSDKDL